MRILAILAVVGLLASPALAGLTPSSLTPTAATGMQPLTEGQGCVGPYANGNLYMSYQTYILPSGTGSVTFAFHWPFGGAPVHAIQLWSSLLYDNSEITITGTTPVGIFTAADNFPGATTWTNTFNPTSGTWKIGDVLGTGVPLWCNAAFPPATATVGGSGIYPFMKVDFHVKGPCPGDGLLDLVVPSAAMLFWSTPNGTAGTWWTGGGIMYTYFTYTTPTYGHTYTGSSYACWGVDVVPEPGSLGLLLAGAACIGGGILRRRR